MKLRFSLIGLLIIVLLLAAGCVPIASGVTTGMVAGSGSDTRGAAEPPDTPTPKPTATPTSTPFVSPLAAPTAAQQAQGNANQSQAQGNADQPQVQAPAVQPVVTEYVVQRGDTLARIAASFGFAVKDLMKANPMVKTPDRIYVGQRLKIPTRDIRGVSVP